MYVASVNMMCVEPPCVQLATISCSSVPKRPISASYHVKFENICMICSLVVSFAIRKSPMPCGKYKVVMMIETIVG